MGDPENKVPLSKMSRRTFVKKSALVSVTFASTLSPIGSKLFAATEQPLSPLYLPPFLARPTDTSIFVTALNGDLESEAVIEYRKEDEAEWVHYESPLSAPKYEFFNWELNGLDEATRYDYRLQVKRSNEDSFALAAEGSFITQRNEPSSYTAVLITDPHTGTFGEGSGPIATLDKVIENASEENADFVLALGDNVAWDGSREYPQEDTNGAVYAYALYRKHIGPLTQNCPHFGIIGNWAGESGKFPEKNIRMVAEVRKAFLPNPNHETYPQGGNDQEDYYAFSWGGVLYVMLNIQTYSKPSDIGKLDNVSSDVSSVDDWTIGEKQMAWLEKTLANATEGYRFVCMHHPAGGNAGNPHDTLYGRGGARAWNSGEQLKIHELMKEHKVQIFFYGHDHVFVDDVVDGIHYTLPGSCGAPWKFTPDVTGYDRFWPDSGHARLEVTPDAATVTFINLEGDELHQFSVLPV